MNEEFMGRYIWLPETGDKKIQVIKVIRANTGLGLKEAKHVADNIGTGIAIPFKDFRNASEGEPALVNEFRAAGVYDCVHGKDSGKYPTYRLGPLYQDYEQRERDRLGDQYRDEEKSEPVPLTIDQLTLKLAMYGLTPVQVETMAWALYGIEDAHGSLREASERMKEAL